MADEWTVLLITYDQMEAEILKDILESGDIPVELRSAKVSPYPVNVGRMGEVKVMIRETDRAEAEEVLRRFREDPAAPERGIES
ncbi:MAG: hypothetical protein C0402_15510 [Thermodesulfovibrio sp.]|nr:hypothetical protein [Thermodesulfovibrio sp.]